MFRTVTFFAATLVVLTLLGCNRSAPLTPERQQPRETVAANPADTLAALFELTIDPVALTATAVPSRGLSAQPPQGQIYDLDIAKFQKVDSLQITGFGTDASGNFVVSFSHAHPFPAPDITLPATALNRADLGYTGRVVLVVDEDPDSFFDGEVQLDPRTVVGADGYVNPGDLLAGVTPADGFAYPYVLLADEAKDNRVGISNGGDMRGNHLPASKGWQRSNLGATGDGWTGFDYMHGGQTITNSMTISAAALAGGPRTFHAAILIKYTDPRGAGGKINRLPSEPANVLEFAYRLPYSALDLSVITSPPLVVEGATGAESTLNLAIRDWDAKATEAADTTVGDETDVRLIQQGASGLPDVEFDCPALRNSPFAVPVADNSRTGFPGSELEASATIANVLGTAAPAIYYGCARLIDPEDGDPASNTYHFGVDADTIVPSADRALEVRSYQVIPVAIGLNVPVIQQVFPEGVVGSEGTSVQFSATVQNVPTAWSWSFGGGATPNTSTDESPDVILSTAGTYNGSVTASNQYGTSDAFPFSFEVGSATDPPVVDSVSPTGYVGCSRGGQVTFSAEVTNGATSWYWNFGEEVDPPTAFTATPTVTMLEAGTYDGVLIATNAAGDSAPFPFEFTSGPGWTSHEIKAGAVPLDGAHAQVLLYGSRPLLFVFDREDGSRTVRLYASTQQNPNETADWSEQLVTSFVQNEETAEVPLAPVVVDGRLLLLFQEGLNLRAASATVLEPVVPTGPAQWQIHTIADELHPDDIHATVANDRAAVAYSKKTTGDNAIVQRAKALVANPSQASDWDIIEIGEDDTSLNSGIGVFLEGGNEHLIVTRNEGNRMYMTIDEQPEFEMFYDPDANLRWQQVHTIQVGGQPRILVSGIGYPDIAHFYRALTLLPTAGAEIEELPTPFIPGTSTASATVVFGDRFALMQLDAPAALRVAIPQVMLPVTVDDYDIENITTVSQQNIESLDLVVLADGTLGGVAGLHWYGRPCGYVP